MTQSTAAATDVGEFWTDLDGGQFEHMLSVALSQTAAAVVDHEKKGKVTITLDLERIPGTHQVRIGHTYQARDAVRRLLGASYPARMAELGAGLQRLADARGTSVLKEAISAARAAHGITATPAPTTDKEPR